MTGAHTVHGGGARRGALLLAMVLLLGALGLPGSLPEGQAQERSSVELQRELDAAEQERRRVAGELGALRSELTDAEEELATVGARLEDARSRLTAAEGQVALAELALADAEVARVRAEQAHVRAVDLLADAEADLAAQEDLLTAQLVHTFKYGASGAQAGAMALEILRRAADPNAFSVGMKQLETVVDVQDATVRQVFALRVAREERSDAAARARAVALEAEAAAAGTLVVVEELRVEAAGIAAEVEREEQAQQVLVASLRTTAEETAAVLRRVQARQDTLAADLVRVRAAEEAARREAERQAAEAAARAARAARDAPTNAGGGRLNTPGASGGPAMAAIVCPVQGAVAGRDFSNDWGYPRAGGRYHQGNDIFAASGTPVVAVDDAVIVRWNPPSAPTGLGGITVTYRTRDGSEWYNAHLATVAEGISPGVSVARGQTVGTVGNTGNARTTPPHLHLGRRYGGLWVNPWPTTSPVC